MCAGTRIRSLLFWFQTKRQAKLAQDRNFCAYSI